MYNKVGLIGVFDGMHQGHINIIKNASKLGTLFVGVVRDKAVKRVKGNDRPLFDENHRLAIVENMSSVFRAFLVDDFDASLVQKECKHFKFNIFVRGEDQDHIKGFDKLDKDITIVTINRTPNISTTDIAKRIKQSE